MKYLCEYGSATRKEFVALLKDKFPKSLDDKNRINRVRYLLDIYKKKAKYIMVLNWEVHVGK